MVGVSAGGALVQLLALGFPDRVLSLVLISTSPATLGGRSLRSATERFNGFLASAEVDWSDRGSVIEYLVAYERMLAGGVRPFDDALMDVDPSILVTLLNPLEADGYLSRERDPTDRRRHVVTITRRGEEQLDRAAQAQRDAEDELFAGFTDTQRAQLRGLLLVLRQRLTPNRTPPAPLPARQSPPEP